MQVRAQRKGNWTETPGELLSRARDVDCTAERVSSFECRLAATDAERAPAEQQDVAQSTTSPQRAVCDAQLGPWHDHGVANAAGGAALSCPVRRTAQAREVSA